MPWNEKTEKMDFADFVRLRNKNLFYSFLRTLFGFLGQYSGERVYGRNTRAARFE